MRMKVYTEGWKAFEEDKKKVDCPYLPGSQQQDFADWLQGWHDASDNELVNVYYDRLYR